MEDKNTLDNESQEALLPKKNSSQPSRRNRLSYNNSCAVSIFGLLVLMFLGLFVIKNLPQKPSERDCQAPTIRSEWRTLPVESRKKYVAAVQCLSERPSRLGLNTTRYDDFVYSHLAVSDDTHGTAISLPWHRVYVQRYEDALRNECGYDDSLPYWDWTLDSSNPSSSPVWSIESGLGGNGSVPENCLIYGPLAKFKPQYPEPHCLKRNFSGENMYGAEYTPTIVEELIVNSKTYHDFRFRLESGPHRFIHLMIGGEMPELWSSNDPIFFLHHAQIDQLWWKWQHQTEYDQIRGYDSIDGDLGTDDDSVPITEDYMLVFNGLGDDLTAGDVLSTESSLLCYTYE